MSKNNDHLFSRLRKKFSKTTELARAASQGELSSFSGIFRVTPLGEQEQSTLEQLLRSYATVSMDGVTEDLVALSLVTSEIKAISNQAAMLHGERIKKAQTILKRYREGAFSAWLVSTYGNRQTPYNFLHYYEFYLSLPPHLTPKLDAMPRQAVYTLASREASLEKKHEILENYQGETKQEMLTLIRREFPLENGDGRQEQRVQQAIHQLHRLLPLFQHPQFKPDVNELASLEDLCSQLAALLENKKHRIRV